MHHRLPPFIGAAVIVALVGTPVLAHTKPDDAVAYRQGIMMGIVWNIDPMGAMVKGKVPFDKEKFALFAGRAAQLAPMVVEGFTPPTAEAKSEAKPELWQHLDDFKKRMKDLEDATAKLATIAKSSDEDAMKEQFGATVKIRKGCHDEYQKKH